MIEIPRKLVATVEAVLDIAYYGTEQPVLASDIAIRQRIARRGLEPLLQRLSNVKILTSNRGPNGGYRLARDSSKISVGDIARAINYASVPNPACAGSSDLSSKVTAPFWNSLNNKLWQELDTMSIAELCRLACKAGIERTTHERADNFII